MKPKGSFLFNLLNKKIIIGSIETDVATVGLLIYSSLLLITPFLVSTLFVGVMSLLFGVLVSLWWGLRGGIAGGFWVTGSVMLSFWLNPAVSDLGKMIVNLSIVFLVCIILGKISDFTREKQTKLEKVNQELQRQKKLN